MADDNVIGYYVMHPPFGPLESKGWCVKNVSEIYRPDRHVGICHRPACGAQVGDFVNHVDQFAAKNARVLMIYPGSSSQLDQHAEDFLQGTTLPKPITFLLDPGYEFTNRSGLRWDAPKETAYPSTLVVDEAGVITFVKISDTHRGRSTAAEVLAVIGD